jgi:hypothetical protein
MQIRAFPILAVIFGILVGQLECVGLHAQDMSLTNLPSSFYGGDYYKVDPYIRAAGQLQDMGREAAIRQLLILAKTAVISNASANEPRIAILCQMLFTKRNGSTFERPRILGGASFYGEDYTLKTTSYTNWPSEPIELVDGVPFVVVYGYTYEGFWDPHGAESYVRYCMTNCDWSSLHFTPKSQGQKRDALKKLFDSPKWRRPLVPWERQSLSQQIQQIQ